MAPRGFHSEKGWKSSMPRTWKPAEPTLRWRKVATGIQSNGSKEAADGHPIKSCPAGTVTVCPGNGVQVVVMAGAIPQAGRFRTDSEISGAVEDDASSKRKLQRFNFDVAEPLGSGYDGILEETSDWKRGAWDQFKVNEEKFGVVSSFKEDLSQYTTVLDKRTITKEMREKAESIALEIERGGGHVHDEEYHDDADEEDMFSAVPRGPRVCDEFTDGWHDDRGGNVPGIPQDCRKDEASKALLASLRATPVKTPKVVGGHRTLVEPKVQEWWRARRAAGADVPPGAEATLVCPFSHRALGDVSQMVTHWAETLSRAVDVDDAAAKTASTTVQRYFNQLAGKLRWSQMAKVSSLDQSLPTQAPRAGSVWERILTRIKDDDKGNFDTAERLVLDVLAETVRLRCWRREQKIEHREVLEGIAAGLALYALSTTLGISVLHWGAGEGECSSTCH